MSLIEVYELTKRYEMDDVVVHALRGVTLSIEAGDFVAIMGPSGSGKSTLMNMLGCLDRPTSGRYLFDGIDAATLSRDERAELRGHKIGFVFQGFNLLPRTSAIENVELPLAYAHVSRKERLRRSREALGRVGLGDRLFHLPSQLSGGQQQRVAIARALVTGAPLLMADEPTGNLDSKTSEEVMGLLVDLNLAHGVTVVMVTHEPDIAAFARRVIVCRDGLISSDTVSPQRRVPAGVPTPSPAAGPPGRTP